MKRHRGGEVRDHRGPRRQCKDDGFYSDRKWLLEGLEKRRDVLLLRFSARINLATVLRMQSRRKGRSGGQL